MKNIVIVLLFYSFLFQCQGQDRIEFNRGNTQFKVGDGSYLGVINKKHYLNALLRNSPAAHAEFEQFKRARRLGNVALGGSVGVGIILGGIVGFERKNCRRGEYFSRCEGGVGVFVLLAATSFGGILKLGTNRRSKKHLKRAVAIYNNDATGFIERSIQPSIKFGTTSGGVGVVVAF